MHIVWETQFRMNHGDLICNWKSWLSKTMSTNLFDNVPKPTFGESIKKALHYQWHGFKCSMAFFCFFFLFFFFLIERSNCEFEIGGNLITSTRTLIQNGRAAWIQHKIKSLFPASQNGVICLRMLIHYSINEKFSIRRSPMIEYSSWLCKLTRA